MVLSLKLFTTQLQDTKTKSASLQQHRRLASRTTIQVKIERKLKFDHFFGQNSKIRKIDRRNRKVSRTVVQIVPTQRICSKIRQGGVATLWLPQRHLIYIYVRTYVSTSYQSSIAVESTLCIPIVYVASSSDISVVIPYVCLFVSAIYMAGSNLHQTG